ncbi:MAG: NAD-dependent epimerase/dehydratase family protein [Bacteroidales bacterium]|nr:NAD-dependent epimerase/dehydratase family protein [Bacteroidales bacterium]
MKENKLNILITGAYGFVGSNISAFLKKNLDCNLIALDIKQGEGVYDSFFTWNDVEMIDWNSVDTVIHLAGMAHDTKNTTDESKYFEINTGLTQKVFDLFSKSDAKRFIFFSSVKAATDRVNGDALREDVTCNPKTPYGRSKRAAEEYIINNNGFELPDKRVFVLRPAMIHGKGNKGNLNLLYKVVCKGIPWPLGKFDNLRSFMGVDNLCFIIKSLIEKDIASGIYNVADDKPLSTNLLIMLIAKSLGKKPVIWGISKGLIKCIAKIGDIIHLPLNSERLMKLTENFVVDNSKIKKAIGCENLPNSAEKGMFKTLLSFKG